MTAAKRWTKEDEEFLINNYQKMSNKDLADRFGVTTISVQRKLSRLGLIRQVQKKWEDDEEGYLKENFMDLSDKELADRYGVSEISIKRKLNRMGLKRSGKKNRKPVSVDKEKKLLPKVEKTTKVEVPREKPVSRSNDREYEASETYDIGETVFHPVFNDKGKVIDKFPTAGGHQAIIVNFHRAGRKILLEGVGSTVTY